jgi:hypothetical protein
MSDAGQSVGRERTAMRIRGSKRRAEPFLNEIMKSICFL